MQRTEETDYCAETTVIVGMVCVCDLPDDDDHGPRHFDSVQRLYWWG